MTISSNQFQVADSKGDIKNKHNDTDRYDAIVYASESGTLVPGDPVKLVDTTKKEIVVAKAADTDAIVGFIGYEATKKNSYVANDRVTVYGDYSIMVMEASAAFAVGTELMIVATGAKVATATAGKKVIGVALQKATADAQLVQVKVKIGDLVPTT